MLIVLLGRPGVRARGCHTIAIRSGATAPIAGFVRRTSVRSDGSPIRAGERLGSDDKQDTGGSLNALMKETDPGKPVSPGQGVRRKTMTWVLCNSSGGQ